MQDCTARIIYATAGAARVTITLFFIGRSVLLVLLLLDDMPLLTSICQNRILLLLLLLKYIRLSLTKEGA